MIASTFSISAHSFCRDGWLAARAVHVDGDLAGVVLAARDRHEPLRIAPHAVLGDVETVALLLFGDTQAVGGLDQTEDRVRHTEHRGERSRDTESLDQELV